MNFPGNEKYLSRQCRVFVQHVTGRPADSQFIKQYISAHQYRDELSKAGFAEGVIVRVASLGPFAARILDLLCAIFQPGGLLRKKLTLVFAIAETRQPYYRDVEAWDGTSGIRGNLILSVIILSSVILTLTGLLLYPMIGYVRNRWKK